MSTLGSLFRKKKSHINEPSLNSVSNESQLEAGQQQMFGRNLYSGNHGLNERKPLDLSDKKLTAEDVAEIFNFKYTDTKLTYVPDKVSEVCKNDDFNLKTDFDEVSVLAYTKTDEEIKAYCKRNYNLDDQEANRFVSLLANEMQHRKLASTIFDRLGLSEDDIYIKKVPNEKDNQYQLYLNTGKYEASGKVNMWEGDVNSDKMFLAKKYLCGQLANMALNNDVSITPDFVTVNGDKITDMDVYVSKTNRLPYVAARINGLPLKPQAIDRDMEEAFLNHDIGVEDMMKRYYPTKLLPRVPVEEFQLPKSITVPDGMGGQSEKPIKEFFLFLDKDPESPRFNQYWMETNIDGQKMVVPASDDILDQYFDRTKSIKDIVVENFGEHLHLADHYKQFNMLDNSNIEKYDVRITKNKNGDFAISAKLPNGERTPAKIISFDDQKSFFEYKTANKSQLASKYLENEIKFNVSATPKQEQTRQRSLSL